MKWVSIFTALAIEASTLSADAQQIENIGKLTETNYVITLSSSISEIVAGENVSFGVALNNRAPKSIVVSPLQPFLYLNLIVNHNGERVPPQVKISLSPDEDINIGQGEIIPKEIDLCTWFPLGLFEGVFELYVAYVPEKNNRDLEVKSNTIHLRVVARTAEQENAYQDYVAVLSSSGQEAIEKGSVFLDQHENSMFEGRVRIELANRYLAQKDWGHAIDIMSESNQMELTNAEMTKGRYLIARALRGSGRFSEAVSELEKIQESWARREANTWRRTHLRESEENKP